MSNKLPVAPSPTWDGHYPLVGLTIVENFPRPDKELVESFRHHFVPDIADWLGVLYCVDHSIRPAYDPMPRLLGTAFTVRVPPGDNLMVKKALHMAQPGDVIVVDSRGHTDWCLGGGGMAVMAHQRGIAGMLLDGAYRDIAEVESVQFPMFLKGVAPATGPKRGPGEINVPVNCGGVIVHPGDIVVGDTEGVVIIPQRHAQRIKDQIKDKPLTVRTSPEDWEPDIASRDKVRDAYFDEVLKARNCEYIKGSTE